MKRTLPLPPKKRLVLVAHDHCKEELLEWVLFNKGTLQGHTLLATGTTGRIISERSGLSVECFISGPLGGDQQIGAHIVDGKVDAMFFFWDPLSALPHDPDVRALLRVAVLYNIPIAMNRSTADFMISSHLFRESYERIIDIERPRI